MSGATFELVRIHPTGARFKSLSRSGATSCTLGLPQPAQAISPLVLRLSVAALIGLAVGIERERSGQRDPDRGARFAGVRTFLLLGIVGGTCGWLQSVGAVWLAAALVLTAGALVAAAYVVGARTAGVDGTTEVAAIVVVALGLLAGIGEMSVASGAAAVVLVALSEKATIHGALRRLSETEVRAALYFAVLALVILPILPDRSFGPWGGLNPRSLWIVVLIFSGLNFAGFVARRLVGSSRGYGVTGALGGLVSSTAVTLHFSRRSRVAPALARGLAIGTVAASTVLLPRVLIVSAILNPRVALGLLPLLGPPFLAGVALVGWWLWRSPLAQEEGESRDIEATSPLGVRSAITMALAFQVALMAIAFVQSTFGSPGVLASAALLGLTDMDALTLAMNRLGQDPSSTALAALAIGTGVLANALLKLGIAVSLGAPEYRRVAAAGLGVLAAVSVFALVLQAR